LSGYLTDTALLIYLLQGAPLPASVARVVSGDDPVWYSSLNVAEASIKYATGKLYFPPVVGADLLKATREVALQLGWRQLVLSQEHAVRLAYLPRIHNDPFDRLLISQAIVEDLTLISSDSVFPRYTDLKLLRFSPL
jgi:PIN domain nuclease of toxin-antitoxin system